MCRLGLCRLGPAGRIAVLSLVCSAVLASGPACVRGRDGVPADWVLTGARIYTVNDSQPWAQAVAIRGDRIVYVGDDEGARAFIGSGTRQVAMNDRLILPGLIDSHTHPDLIAATASTKAAFDLPFTLDKEEILKAVARYARENPDVRVIRGFYWPTRMFDARGPRKEEIDRVVSDRAVILTDDSGHSEWLNSKALELMGVDRSTPDPIPGLKYFVRDASGNPTGWAKEFPTEFFMSKLGITAPVPNPKALEDFLNDLSSLGVVALLDADGGEAGYAIVSKLDREGRLPLRYEGSKRMTGLAALPGEIRELRRFQTAYGGRRLHFNTIKLYLDGTHEVRTSALLQPFADELQNSGRTSLTKDELVSTLLELSREEIDLHIHMIGDRAARLALDAVEEARRKSGSDLHTQVTFCHLELVDDADFPRFAPLNVAANFTPHWHGGYIAGASVTLGLERYNRMYRAQPLIDAGARVAFSGDNVSGQEWREGRTSPFFGMQLGHTRIEPRPEFGGQPRSPASERLKLADLVKGYTLNGARQLRMADFSGSIEVGKSADMVVLNEDLFTVAADKIRQIKPVAVMMEGAVIHGTLE